jgi:hypothetical protein
LRRQADTGEGAPTLQKGSGPRPKLHPEVKIVALLILLALIVALFIGLGFVIKWLFIVAVVAALVWVITFFVRGAA